MMGSMSFLHQSDLTEPSWRAEGKEKQKAGEDSMPGVHDPCVGQPAWVSPFLPYIPTRGMKAGLPLGVSHASWEVEE